MQELFIFDLDSMDDNHKIKDDLVEMKASNKIDWSFVQSSWIPSGVHNFPS